MQRIGGSGLLSSCDHVRLRQLALHSTISLIYKAFLHKLLTTPQLLHIASSPSLRCTTDGCNAGVRSTCGINLRPAVVYTVTSVLQIPSSSKERGEVAQTDSALNMSRG